MTHSTNNAAASVQPKSGLDTLLSKLPYMNRTPVVAVVRLEGVIGKGGVGRRGLTLDSVAPQLRQAFSLRGVAAVALEINSPGGSPVQSDLIATRIRALSEEKGVPVFAFCEDAAASGGYWLACAADEIHAMPGSIVGSIGVVSAGFGFVDAIGKLGIERRVHTAGTEKAILDPFQPEKKADLEILKRIQVDLHDQFKTWIEKRRTGKLTDARDLFTGAFWTGREAVGLGLVDGLGDCRSVMRARFGDKTRFRSFSKPKSRIQRLIGLGGDQKIGDLADAAMDRLEERIYWQKIGL
ncbi:S49 family peptidase [Rhodospirillaceae bacterium KN72]|uniref:S49 family peptidase n=1 Tax=Pacificispira spongiicola TaxID=2729598 RepID=A0A7Y0DZB3_9PROT|nr:S49 family peptidase [Pacificispira spongiicola]NMM44372.1 S49 family peptidase [Pacificispira spongiicola]